MKILVIEDSERLSRSLSRGLTKAGFTVDCALDGSNGLALAETYDYDVIVLDLMLPKMSGLEVLKTLRRNGGGSHILILSAKDRVEDRIAGLRAGADDYLVKPFSFDELCARVQALVRRNYVAKNPVLTIGPLTIDTARRAVWRDGREIRLTPNEYRVLEYLAYRRGKVASQAELLEQLYSGGGEVSSNVIEVVISALRRKIHQCETPPIVRTKRGFGYIIE